MILHPQSILDSEHPKISSTNPLDPATATEDAYRVLDVFWTDLQLHQQARGYSTQAHHAYSTALMIRFSVANLAVARAEIL